MNSNFTFLYLLLFELSCKKSTHTHTDTWTHTNTDSEISEEYFIIAICKTATIIIPAYCLSIMSMLLVPLVSDCSHILQSCRASVALRCCAGPPIGSLIWDDGDS